MAMPTTHRTNDYTTFSLALTNGSTFGELLLLHCEKKIGERPGKDRGKSGKDRGIADTVHIPLLKNGTMV